MRKLLSEKSGRTVLKCFNRDLLAVLEYVCGEANKVYNCAVYYARQVWFKEKRFVKQGELCRQMKWNRHFTAMYVSSASASL